MESSTVIAFRALVMLACLIVVPMAAIFGSAFPEVVKSVLVDRIWPEGLKIGGVDPTARPEAPPFAAASAPPWRGDQAGMPGNAPPANAAAAGLSNAPSFAPAVETAAAWGSGGGQVRQAVSELPGNMPGAAQRLETSAPQGGPGNMPAVATQVLAQPDRFTWMERRLRDYGATYYLLETWGNDGERYRFHCKMAIANNPGRTRHFEATDTDPLRAMGRVVEQVEAWRSGRVQ